MILNWVFLCFGLFVRQNKTFKVELCSFGINILYFDCFTPNRKLVYSVKDIKTFWGWISFTKLLSALLKFDQSEHWIVSSQRRWQSQLDSFCRVTQHLFFLTVRPTLVHEQNPVRSDEAARDRRTLNPRHTNGTRDRRRCLNSLLVSVRSEITERSFYTFFIIVFWNQTAAMFDFLNRPRCFSAGDRSAVWWLSQKGKKDVFICFLVKCKAVREIF